MSRGYFQDQVFTDADGSKKPFHIGEYEGCRFNNCNFAGNDLSGFQFFDCTFTGCNLSNTIVKQTVLRNCTFINCKIVGVQFDDCNEFLFEVNFENCVLQYSSFYQVKLKAPKFTACNLMEVDFTEADLSGASFAESNLALAVFEHTVLEKADFRTAVNYHINPAVNKIKKAKFSWPGLMGLLGEMGIEVE
jgi:uncharacterized protein YjbI with pentapeptide repeats